ncbi:MAG: universal stress protein [Actinobacteria bacterium]|nr:universal stress protein [Actinomycetota bacterium]
MSDADPRERPDRIVVALDASPHSVVALEAAAELAMLLDAELEGLFVEDIDLFRLCGLPFGHEVGSYTAEVRRVDHAAMERQLRALAAAMRETMERIALRTPIRWSFRVSRGCVVDELMCAAQGAAVISVGRTGRARGRGMGSTARALAGRAPRPLLIAGEGRGLEFPLAVLFTGTPAAERALRLALRLSRRDPALLRVVAWAGADPSLGADDVADAVRRLARAELSGAAAPDSSAPAPVATAGPSVDELLAALRELDGGTIVLPSEQVALLARLSRSVLLVP